MVLADVLFDFDAMTSLRFIWNVSAGCIILGAIGLSVVSIVRQRRRSDGAADGVIRLLLVVVIIVAWGRWILPIGAIASIASFAIVKPKGKSAGLP